jgi:polysaccharide deacetylase 2 family uncharacterized protein YibQ
VPRRGSRRRRSSRPIGSFVALALACAALAVVAVLIVRGAPPPRRHAPHIAHRAAHLPATAPVAVETPATPTETPQPIPAASAEATATPAPIVTQPAAPEPAVSQAPAISAARLALIIDDCGQWPETERGFIALPVALTLSVLPHVRYGDAIAHDAAAAGKGVMLHLPMEPNSGISSGPGEIRDTMDDAAIAAQVRDDIASVPLATGVNNHEGSRATADDRVMRDVAGVLAEHRLFFIDSRTSAATVAQRDAIAAGIPTARRDVFLDDVAEVGAVETQLRHAAELAKTQGDAIAIGHPRPSTLAAVRALLPELEHEGITFVLASTLVR